MFTAGHPGTWVLWNEVPTTHGLTVRAGLCPICTGSGPGLALATLVVCLDLRSSGPTPLLPEPDIHLDASLADSQALRHPRSHWGFSGWPLRPAGGAASRNWMMGGCGANGLNLGDREAGTSGQPDVLSPQSRQTLVVPGQQRINKGPLPHSHLQGSGWGTADTEHTLREVPQLGGRHGGVAGLGAPSTLQTHRPSSQTGQAGRAFVGMRLHLSEPLAADPGQATRPPSAGTRPRPSPHRLRQPLITSNMNAAEGPLPLLPSRTPRNQVRGPGVPCPPSEDPARHCCSLCMSPPQRGPLDPEEA